MFSNLIESGSHAADLKRRGRFLLGTTLFYGLLLAATGVGSIYAYNVHLDEGDGEYEMLTLLRFPPAAESRTAEPRREQRAASTPSRVTQVATRVEISTHPPYHTDQIARAETPEVGPRQNVIISTFNSNPPEAGGPVGPYVHGNPGPAGGGGRDAGPTVSDPVDPPPTIRATPTPAPQRIDKPVPLATSIISSKAIDKPAPPYPQIARVAGIQGPVAVQIVVDEQGRVVSAKATSGNPLLHQAAVQAAYRARFTPTTLNGQAVKVTGSITYNFLLH